MCVPKTGMGAGMVVLGPTPWPDPPIVVGWPTFQRSTTGLVFEER